MRLLIAGHSMVSYRQYSLGRTIAEMGGHDVLILCPQKWNTEEIGHVKEEHFEIVPLTLTTLDRNVWVNHVNLWFRNFEAEVEKFKPDFIYIMQEPFSMFSARICELYPDIKKAVYTWENRSELWLDDAFQQMWDKTDEGVSAIICGNKGALEIAERRRSRATKIVIPQTGIDTDHFRKMDKVPKKYDVGVFGRMIEEKGIRFIVAATKGSDWKVLWQGRGELRPRDAENQWVAHELLPPLYNSCWSIVQFPYNYMGYAEQGNFVPAEGMACEVPAIISNNGSLPDFYRRAPLTMVRQGQSEDLRKAIESLLSLSGEEQAEAGVRGRKWVIDNLSLSSVARRLVRAFEAELGGRR